MVLYQHYTIIPCLERKKGCQLFNLLCNPITVPRSLFLVKSELQSSDFLVVLLSSNFSNRVLSHHSVL